MERPISALYAAAPGYEIVNEIGVPAIREKSLRQTQQLIDLADEAGLPVRSCREATTRGGVVTVNVPNGKEVGQELGRREVLVDYRPQAGIRIAPHFYTKDEELDFTIRGIQRLAGVMLLPELQPNDARVEQGRRQCQCASFWLWPNVLSLDAPSRSCDLSMLVAHRMGVRLDPFEPIALGLAVSVIYITDHLIDTLRPAVGAWEPCRKLFYRNHWNDALALGIAVALVLLACVFRLLWAATLRVGVELSVAVAAYFSLIHLTPSRWRKLWPREIVLPRCLHYEFLALCRWAMERR